MLYLGDVLVLKCESTCTATKIIYMQQNCGWKLCGFCLVNMVRYGRFTTLALSLCFLNIAFMGCEKYWNITQLLMHVWTFCCINPSALCDIDYSRHNWFQLPPLHVNMSLISSVVMWHSIMSKPMLLKYFKIWILIGCTNQNSVLNILVK